MRNRKSSIIFTITVILVLVGGFCFVANSVPPEGKGKKVSYEPVKVFDSSDPPQFVGILVGIFPTGYKASEIYREAEGNFTVYVPDLGKFIELNRTGEIITTRFSFEYLYYKVDGCDDIEGIYAIPHPWDEVLDSAFIAAHRFYTPAEGNTWTYYTVGDQEEVQLESSHDGSSCDDTPSDFFNAYSLTEETLPFILPLTPPLSFQ